MPRSPPTRTLNSSALATLGRPIAIVANAAQARANFFMRTLPRRIIVVNNVYEKPYVPYWGWKLF